MIFEVRDVPWNVSTRILNVCKTIFIPKISNALKKLSMRGGNREQGTVLAIWISSISHIRQGKMQLF
jgi:hypothetical protein